MSQASNLNRKSDFNNDNSTRKSDFNLGGHYPMKSISAIVGTELRWVQPSIFKQTFELRSGDELAATLQFPKLFGRNARAECQDGCWILEEQGIWKPNIVVKQCNEEQPITTVTMKNFTRVTPFTVDQRRTFRITSNFWRSHYSITTDMGESLVSLKVKHFPRHSAEVELSAKAESFPWLLFLLYYIVLLNRRKAGTH